MSDSLQPHELYSPWNSPGQNTEVGSLSLLQGIFATQGWNPGLLHCSWILYQLSHQRKPKNTGVGSLSLLWQISLTQESKWGLLHFRRILYQLSCQGSPRSVDLVLNVGTTVQKASFYISSFALLFSVLISFQMRLCCTYYLPTCFNSFVQI